MKRFALLTCLSFSLATTAVPAEPASAHGDAQLQAAVAELQAQQLALAENQAKIEAKLATIAEAIRVARIYGSRSGN